VSPKPKLTSPGQYLGTGLTLPLPTALIAMRRNKSSVKHKDDRASHGVGPSPRGAPASETEVSRSKRERHRSEGREAEEKKMQRANQGKRRLQGGNEKSQLAAWPILAL